MIARFKGRTSTMSAGTQAHLFPTTARNLTRAVHLLIPDEHYVGCNEDFPPIHIRISHEILKI